MKRVTLEAPVTAGWSAERAAIILFGNELGKMCGPCDTVYDALNASGFQFAMNCMAIETTVGTVELRRILNGPSFILSNVDHLTINDVQVDPKQFID